jgi:hypothetical protein
METYINNKKFSDIILVSSEGEKIYGHKIILSRIPYFENLFNSHLMESFQKEISVDNISYNVLLKIVKFVYTSCCQIEYEDAISLYEAANYFGLDDLKKMCEEKILSIANVDNACDILMVNFFNFKKADEFNSFNLKEKIIKYMIENIQPIILTESFETLLKNYDLALEVLKSFANNKTIVKHNHHSPNSSMFN